MRADDFTAVRRGGTCAVCVLPVDLSGRGLRTVSNRDEAYVPGHTVALSYNTKACEVFIYLNVLATRSCVRFTLNPHTASPLYCSGVRGILK